MKTMRSRALLAITLSLVVAGGLLAGCSGRDIAGIEQTATARVEPLVFDETFGDDVYFQAFSGTYLKAVSIDSVAAHDNLSYAHDSYQSLKVVVPGENSALGAYAGGVLTSVAARDMTGFNALTFWARSSVLSQLNEAGFANDNTGTSLYSAGRSAIPLTMGWTYVVVPIPSPQKIIAERGLFTFAEGFEANNRTGHTLWFDDIKYQNLANVVRVSAQMPSVNKQYLIGSNATIEGTTTTFTVDGSPVTVNHMPTYFDFTSSNPSVAVVDGRRIRVVGAGVDTITAKLDTLTVQGQVIITSFTPPATSAPAPTVPAGDVIPLYSDTYGNWTVDSWNPHWTYSTTQNETYVLNDNANIMYTTFNFVGIEFRNHPIDAGAMTTLHVDVYAPQGGEFQVKLVNFGGANASMNGQAGLSFNATTTPAFSSGGWCQLEIPMSAFVFPAGVTPTRLGQLVLSTPDGVNATPLVLVDNIYWHR